MDIPLPAFFLKSYNIRKALCDTVQYVYALNKFLTRCGVAYTEMSIPFAEYITGDDEQVILDSLFHKICSGNTLRCFDEQVECPAGANHLKFTAETLDHHISPAGIITDVFAHIKAKCCYRRLL